MLGWEEIHDAAPSLGRRATRGTLGFGGSIANAGDDDRPRVAPPLLVDVEPGRRSSTDSRTGTWSSPSRPVPRGARVHDLPQGKAIAAFAAGTPGAHQLEQYIAEQKVAGLIVLQNGSVRLERYALGHSAAGRWTSQSVAKSITSTLVGVAVKDGFITSIDDPVTNTSRRFVAARTTA